MKPHYTYIKSTDFINNLVFDYIETYSFQRGAEYELQQKKIEKEFNSLIIQKSEFNNLNIEEEKKIIALEKLCRFTQYLLNDKNEFHYSSKKTNVFSSIDVKIDLLHSILNTEINNIPSWMCAPTYP